MFFGDDSYVARSDCAGKATFDSVDDCLEINLPFLMLDFHFRFPIHARFALPFGTPSTLCVLVHLSFTTVSLVVALQSWVTSWLFYSLEKMI